MLTIEKIRHLVLELGRKISIDKKELFVRDTRSDNGTPHIEIKAPYYHYVVTERGNEFERKSTKNIDQLLYWIFSDITFTVACDYEVKNRIREQDFRRLMWKHQLHLLTTLKESWAKQEAKEIEETLQRSPYSDTQSPLYKKLAKFFQSYFSSFLRNKK